MVSSLDKNNNKKAASMWLSCLAALKIWKLKQVFSQSPLDEQNCQMHISVPMSSPSLKSPAPIIKSYLADMKSTTNGPAKIITFKVLSKIVANGILKLSTFFLFFFSDKTWNYILAR